MPEEKVLTHYTNRLILIPAGLEHYCAELENPESLSSLLNTLVPDEWPPGEYDKNALGYFRDQFIIHGDKVTGWLSWYAVTKPEEEKPSVLIAAGGFTGFPTEEGEVEIGYSVINSYHRHGYAAEIVQALVQIASGDSRVKKIIARTAPGNIASQMVLEKTGFINTGRPDIDGNLVFERAPEK